MKKPIELSFGVDGVLMIEYDPIRFSTTMAACVYCEAETPLCVRHVPVCLKCSGERETKRKPPASTPPTEIRSILHEELVRTTKQNTEALREFDEVMGQFPSGLPHPDGVQRIKNASSKLTVARKEMATAHNRLNDFLSRGIVPEDLKRSG